MAIQWPLTQLNITQEFGANPDYYRPLGQVGHNGVDLAAPVGTPIYAADDGVVVAAGNGAGDPWMGTVAGNFVRLRHAWGHSAYAHMNQTGVSVGAQVHRGQLIGWVGTSGKVTGPHVHFETFPLNPDFSNGYAGRVNPRNYGLVEIGAGSTGAGSQIGEAVMLHIGNIADKGRGGELWLFGNKGRIHIAGPRDLGLIQRFLRGDVLLLVEVDIVINNYLSKVT